MPRDVRAREGAEGSVFEMDLLPISDIDRAKALLKKYIKKSFK